MTNESPPVKSSKSRPRGRSTASIIKAAKAAGAAAVTFPDGTTVTITHDPASVTDGANGAMNDVERWYKDHAS
jgi:hypothetical protein